MEEGKKEALKEKEQHTEEKKLRKAGKMTGKVLCKKS
jgi:hypothetical protein